MPFTWNEISKGIAQALALSAVGAAGGFFVAAGIDTVLQLKQMKEILRDIQAQNWRTNNEQETQRSQYITLRNQVQDIMAMTRHSRRSNAIVQNRLNRITQIINAQIRSLNAMPGAQPARSDDVLMRQFAAPPMHFSPRRANYGDHDVYNCSICGYDHLSRELPPVILPCGHMFCERGINRWFLQQRTNRLRYSCPNCRRNPLGGN